MADLKTSRNPIDIYNQLKINHEQQCPVIWSGISIFYTDLMEFDIPDTMQCHTISMTLKGFDTVLVDSVYGWLALMDRGLKRYPLDIFDIDSMRLDMGVQVLYHPSVADMDDDQW